MPDEPLENLPEKADSISLPEIPDAVMDELGLDGADIEVVKDYFNKMRYHPVYSLILECKGHACKYVSKCVMAKINRLPEYGSDCPIERGLITVWTADLLQDLEVNPVDVVDQAQVREIVAMYVFEMRANMGYLSKDPMVIETLKNIAFDGTSISELQLHPIFRQLENNHRVVQRLRASLLGTRESKTKAGKAIMDSKVNSLHALMDKVNSAKPVEATVRPVGKAIDG